MQTASKLSYYGTEEVNVRSLKTYPYPLQHRTLKATHIIEHYHTAGELRDFVTEEVNVRSLKTCADPLQYCTLRAEPDYASLGKRLGKGMAKVGKAVKGMSTDQILQFESQGQISLEGETLGSGDIRVRRLPACLLCLLPGWLAGCVLVVEQMLWFGTEGCCSLQNSECFVSSLRAA